MRPKIILLAIAVVAVSFVVTLKAVDWFSPRGGDGSRPAEADLPPGQRAGLHAAAARRLANEGASAHRIAAHLLATDPAGDDGVAGSLLSAARAATANGAPDSAVAYLRRALAEPPSGRLRPDVLLELGFADAIRREWAWRTSRGESTANLAAFAHLTEG